jgi:hypothetical protein
LPFDFENDQSDINSHLMSCLILLNHENIHHQLKFLLLMKITSSLKCLLFGAFLVAMATSPVFGQSFKVGDTHLSAGIGLLPTFYSGYTTLIPPVSLSFEKGIDVSDIPIGVGAFVGFSTSRTPKYDYGFGQQYWWSYTYIIAAARGAYHFELVKDDKLDTYVGLMAGFRYAKVTEHDTGISGFNYDSSAGSGIAYSIFGGARYRIANNMNVFGEIGWGVSLLTLGLDFKIGG